MAKAGTGTGTVTSTPAGITCGADCAEAYAHGTVVTLTATAAAGSVFGSWSAACPGGVLTMNTSKTCTATFNLTPKTLTVTKAGTGTGTVTSAPAGINCGADCTEAYPDGTVVTLTATPAAGATFAGWSGDADCSDGTVTMHVAKTCTATFHTNPLLPKTLTVTKVGTGTVTCIPAGITCGADCTEAYPHGTVVACAATPDVGSTFAGWSGHADCSEGTVTMDVDKTCTATFSLTPHLLTVTKAGTGTGTVTSVPTGITCGADCAEAYPYSTVVTLTASPAAGSVFAGWSGDTDCSDGAVRLNAAKTCTATFNPVPPLTLTVTKTGTGTGTVSSAPAGITCGADCTEAYAYNTVVTLTPTPAASAVFAGWSGHADCSDGAVRMNAAKTCTATFNLRSQTLTVTKRGTGTGTVSSAPAGITCGADCTEPYPHGTVVTLTATPVAGSNFGGWSGDADCSDGIVTMNAAKTCTATFILPPVTPLTLYDNFNNALIDPNKWTGSAFDTLETLKRIVFPVAGDGALQLEARGYGLRTSAAVDEGRDANNRLRFRRPDPSLIRTMRATIKVNEATAVGCPTAGSEITQARIRLLGYFFNAGNGELGRAADDVRGTLEIRRLSNNAVANQLDVRALVIRCTNTECDRAETLFNQTLGTILVGQATTVLMQWEPASNRLLFQLNDHPLAEFVYTLADTVPPMNFFDKKHIELNHFIASCVAAQTSAFMSATVDDVYLNNEALLASRLTAADALAVDTADSAPVEREPFVPEPEAEDAGQKPRR